MQQSVFQLLSKYDKPTPRYTSYPTVPYWEAATINPAIWKEKVVETFQAEKGAISIYVHLPFCENLCTFCACNKRITKDHKVETPYLNAVLKEWQMYKDVFPGKPLIKEIHLGGGTPTFFSPQNLKLLIETLLEGAEVADDHEFSVEVHPNFSTEEHLKVLASVGFNRISLGVQDFDPEVQYVINRIQSFETTQEVVNWARKYGYNSVNIDLVYGLPKQTLSSIEHTIEQIRKLKPERIAYYSYAHVPWKSKFQRRFTEDDLPLPAEKLNMYMQGSEWLKAAGYTPIGMDHFALPDDKLLKAYAKGEMHRNFMGYTTTNNKLIIGLGASSISDAWGAFFQNEKDILAYQQKVNEGELPFMNGHLLNEEDLILRKNILELMCAGKTILDTELLEKEFVENALKQISLLDADGLLHCNGNEISVTPKGSILVRNICAAIDARLWRKQIGSNVFSKAI